MNPVPPFIPNSEDDMHCVNAVFRMVAKHYLNKDFTWDEIDALTKAIPGKATWTLVGATAFANMGLKVKNIEPVDYERLHAEGVSYLATIVGKDVSDYYFNRSNIASVIECIPEYLKYVEHETRRASIPEIIGYLKEGKLIGAEIKIMNDQPRFDLHFALLYDYDGHDIILHDPGAPPSEGRRMPLEKFEEAFNYPGANGEILVFSNE